MDKLLTSDEAGFNAGVQFERESIRARTKMVAEKTWRAGDWYIGPQDHILEKFIDALLEDDDATTA